MSEYIYTVKCNCPENGEIVSDDEQDLSKRKCKVCGEIFTVIDVKETE